jgi:hypothetical protein
VKKLIAACAVALGLSPLAGCCVNPVACLECGLGCAQVLGSAPVANATPLTDVPGFAYKAASAGKVTAMAY